MRQRQNEDEDNKRSREIEDFMEFMKDNGKDLKDEFIEEYEDEWFIFTHKKWLEDRE